MAKGKRQAARLRKSSTGAEVDAYYAKAASDARTGGDLRVAADEELFVIDTAPTPKDKLHVRTARATRRAAARMHSTAVDNILAVRPPQHYPEPGVHKKQNKAHTFKALVAAMPANAKKTKSTQRTHKRAVAYDLWDSQDFDVHNQTTLTELARKPMFTKKPVGVKSLNAVAAVEVDEPGCSFNPPKDAHEEVLAKAVAVEVEKDLQRELKPTAALLARSTINELIAEELLRTHLDTEDQREAAESAHESDADAETDGAGVKKSRAVDRSSKLTKAERNKQALKKERSREHAAAVAAKTMRKELNMLAHLQKEISEEEKRRDVERLRKLAVRQKRRTSEPARLGKRRYKPEPLQVQLTEEVTGSIRQLKATPTLVRDRFKSFQKREMIEPRVLQKSKKSRMYKQVETGTAGERERESHYALQAEIANRKLGKSML